MENKNVQVIDLSKLGLDQLSGLKSQLDQEFTYFTESLQQLKIAQVKYSESAECVEKLTSENKGNELLVPLTSCMYVPGKIYDPETLLVNVGTGYYIEKQRNDATDYFNRKVKYVTEQMEKLQKIASEKNKLREVVMDMIELKMNQQLSALKKEGMIKT